MPFLQSAQILNGLNSQILNGLKRNTSPLTIGSLVSLGRQWQIQQILWWSKRYCEWQVRLLKFRPCSLGIWSSSQVLGSVPTHDTLSILCVFADVHCFQPKRNHLKSAILSHTCTFRWRVYWVSAFLSVVVRKAKSWSCGNKRFDELCENTSQVQFSLVHAFTLATLPLSGRLQ